MIRHVAVFKFNDDMMPETIDDIDNTLATLPDIIPEILTFRTGRDIGLTGGAWDYGVVADFASSADYTTYATNPDHVHMVKNVVGPHVKQSARLQYECQTTDIRWQTPDV
ncbi:MAG: Dabb family protein [Actinomycetia bacterium]|nr:Dabb family protein [Actinomycetes bacterium]